MGNELSNLEPREMDSALRINLNLEPSREKIQKSLTRNAAASAEATFGPLPEPIFKVVQFVVPYGNDTPLTYEIIDEFLQKGQLHSNKFTMDLVEIIQFDRTDQISQGGHCRWLWHGTYDGNIGQILRNGFSISTAANGLCGRGIYFADVASKSAQYCRATGATYYNGTAYLLLCKVYVGHEFVAKKPYNSAYAPPAGYGSVRCFGAHTPDSNGDRNIDGATMSLGYIKTRSSNNKKCFQLSSNKRLQYNEYVIYTPSFAQVKYVVKFRFT